MAMFSIANNSVKKLFPKVQIRISFWMERTKLARNCLFTSVLFPTAVYPLPARQISNYHKQACFDCTYFRQEMLKTNFAG